MNSPGFPDHSEILFGREQDLAYLQKRAAQSGITAVMARPRMGKSWLLTELARRLSIGPAQDGSPLQTLTLSAPRHFLVGLSSPEGFCSIAPRYPKPKERLYARIVTVGPHFQQATN
jgi:hypothetical protein